MSVCVCVCLYLMKGCQSIFIYQIWADTIVEQLSHWKKHHHSHRHTQKQLRLSPWHMTVDDIFSINVSWRH